MTAMQGRGRNGGPHVDVDYFLGRKYFLGGGLTVYRGRIQDYNQFFVRFGYRFDNRR